LKLTVSEMKEKHDLGVELVSDYLKSQKCKVERIKRDTFCEVDNVFPDSCEEYDLFKLLTPEEVENFSNIKVKDLESLLKSRGYRNIHVLYSIMNKNSEQIKKIVSQTKEEYQRNKVEIKNYFLNMKKGDLYVKYPQFHEEMFLKIVNSEYLSKKSINNFKGRYVVFVNQDDVTKSRVMRRKSIENYFNAALAGATKESKIKPFNFKNFKNCCFLEDFGMYFTQYLIMNCGNDVDNLRLLNEAYFNKVLPRLVESNSTTPTLSHITPKRIAQKKSIPTSSIYNSNVGVI